VHEVLAEGVDVPTEIVRKRRALPHGICQPVRRVPVGLRFQLAMHILQIIIQIFDHETKALKKRVDSRSIDLHRESELGPRVLDNRSDVAVLLGHELGKTDAAHDPSQIFSVSS
jgi:hypothetical protein